jgi:hypothetical protein
MRFRLVYDGPLPSSQGHHKNENQWAIRRNLQPQLAELWTFKPALLGVGDADASIVATNDASGDLTLMPFDNREQRLTPVERGDHKYLPIVRSSLLLACTLDILFLRKDGPGEIVSNAGDLDNRIKTLFDGLRVPEVNQPRPSDVTTDPFHVLLEDDKLITSFAIRTDRLLHRPNESRDSVVLIIDVIVSPMRVRIHLNSGFTWD